MVDEKANFILIPDEDSAARCDCSEYCRKVCKGRDCCQNSGCVLAPSDVYVLAHEFTREERIKAIIMLLKRGDYSIDHKMLRNKNSGAFILSGSPFDRRSYSVSRDKLIAGEGVLYLRARNKDKKIVDIIHFNWEADGPCASWDPEKGCKFTYAKRPKGGRMLIPDDGLRFDGCEAKYHEIDAAREWLKFQDVMYEVFKYFKNLDM